MFNKEIRTDLEDMLNEGLISKRLLIDSMLSYMSVAELNQMCKQEDIPSSYEQLTEEA